MPSPLPPAESAIVIASPWARLLAASASVRDGMSTCASASGARGVQSSSRTAKRYLSVAASVSRAPLISRRTPVSIGKVSSRPAATATWATAMANTALSTEPAVVGIDGSFG